MKAFFKIILMVVVVLVIIGVTQSILDINIASMLKDLLGGTELKSVHTTIGQEITTPVFEIVSLEVFYPHNIGMIEVDKFEWWKLNIGTVFVIVEYDSYFRLGVRNPDLIHIERIDDTVYVDESTITIELLDAKLNNFKHIRTFTSNPFVINNAAEEYLFQAINNLERELTINIIENGQSNFEYARKNFMKNYENLCKAMGLNVVWRNDA